MKTTVDVQGIIQQAEAALAESVWPRLEETGQVTFNRVLDAFLRHKVGSEHFTGVTGYGHDDLGRATLDKVFADTMQAEAAIVRPQFVSGTHAISVALNGCLSSGDVMLSITGHPYDTLEEVIGLRGDSARSLKNQGVIYREISVFDENHQVRTTFAESQAEAIRQARMIYIQRSRGYSFRPTLSIGQIEILIQSARTINPNAIVMVDNCYGEFTEADEPPAVGADLIAGSLIKNPGGGIVPAGGYVAGRADLVSSAADALTCPGVGDKGGYMFDLTRLMLQGLFLAPGMVKEAMKSMTLAARVFEHLGYETAPAADADSRGDIIQIIRLHDPEKLIAFCKTLQSVSPVDSAITPIPAVVPGYADQVVMAGGTFIEGSTIELSADGPLRPPYAVFLQGGLTVAHTRYFLERFLAAHEC